MDPLVRKWLEPRRLASGAVLGVGIGLPSILLLGSEGPKAMFYIGVALMVVLTAPWIVSVLYLRTERGRAARDDYAPAVLLIVLREREPKTSESAASRRKRKRLGMSARCARRPCLAWNSIAPVPLPLPQEQ